MRRLGDGAEIRMESIERRTECTEQPKERTKPVWDEAAKQRLREVLMQLPLDKLDKIIDNLQSP